MLKKEQKWNHNDWNNRRQKKSRRQKQKKKNKNNEQKKVTNMVNIHLIISIITFNINNLHASRQISEWIKKHDPTICCLQETHVKIYRHT